MNVREKHNPLDIIEKETYTIKNKGLETLQYVLSIIEISFFILSNLMLGWGSAESLKIILPIFCLYNIWDTIAGQYWNTDKVLLLHHTFCLMSGFYALYIGIENINDNSLSFFYWVSLAELSSFFGTFRWFFRKTNWAMTMNLLFGLSFLIIRPISTYYSFQYGYNDNILFTVWLLYAFVNIYWIILIFTVSKKVFGSFSHFYNKLKSN